MQRNMSYRKPVPEYIPSPPPSPLPSTSAEALNSTRPEEEVLDEKPIPPLPDNWREILAEVTAIEAALMKTDLTNTHDVGVSTHHDIVPSEGERNITEILPFLSGEPATFVNVDQDQGSISNIVASQHLHPPVQRNKRGLPTTYRPPTPPLRSHSKQTLLTTDKNTEDIGLVSDGNSSHGTYFPNTPSNPFHRSYTMQVKPSSSFRTERTMVSTNTTNYSIGWPIGLPASSRRPMYSDPTLLIQKRNVDAFRVPESDSSNDPNADVGCFACWPNFSGWTKKLPGFAIISK